MKETRINIENIPFSAYGSMLAMIKPKNKYEFMLLDSQQHFGQDNAVRITLLDKPQDISALNGNEDILPSVPFEYTAVPESISVKSGDASADICLIGDYRLSVVAENTCFALFMQGGHKYGISKNGHYYECLSVNERRYMIVETVKGQISVNGKGDMYGNNLIIVPEDGKIEFEIQVAQTELRTDPVISHEESKNMIRKDWEAFLALMPEVPSKHEEFARVTWFNQWSSFIHAQDVFSNDTMLMSKKVMSRVWTWDHCFNALCLAEADSVKAFNQFFVPYPLQSESGVLYDAASPNHPVFRGDTKPPVHGWCLNKMMDMTDIPVEDLEKAYLPMAKQCEYWFRYRDEDGDGIPAYPMGCDSGWDNATVYETVGHYMESPDLPSFLVLQMKALSRIANILGKTGEAEEWERRAEETLAKMIEHCWDGEKFVTKQDGTHIPVTNTGCLINYMPLVLGEYLPKDISDKTAEAMVKNNLTKYGLATEAPSSPLYTSDGYWRGPIWAPSTYLIVDGLRRMGKRELAFDIARRFCNLCAFDAEGNYENFDALKGQGLRAPGYTWTGSVYMCLLQDFREEFEKENI